MDPNPSPVDHADTTAEQQQRDRRRRSSLERYRPGGGGGNGVGAAAVGATDDGDDHGVKRLPVEHGQVEGDDRRYGRGGNRRGNYSGRGRGGPSVAADGQLGHLMDQMNLGDSDLRHRLNQRSRDVQQSQWSPVQQPANGGSGGGRENHRRVQGRGVGGNYQDRAPKKKNTENFKPSHAPPDLRIVVADPGMEKFVKEMTSRDVVVVSGLFGRSDDLTLYHKLLKELEATGGDCNSKLWQSWHGDSHLIADDKKRWKEECPTFALVIQKMKDYFGMDVKATRLNWYRDSTEWKPFHHDAAAVKPDKARTQNFTVAVSFGMEREVAFEHATTKTVIALPQTNGTIYTFGKDVNIQWRHGILQLPPEKFCDQGRLSIIAWGWNEQTDV